MRFPARLCARGPTANGAIFMEISAFRSLRKGHVCHFAGTLFTLAAVGGRGQVQEGGSTTVEFPVLGQGSAKLW